MSTQTTRHRTSWVPAPEQRRLSRATLVLAFVSAVAAVGAILFAVFALAPHLSSPAVETPEYAAEAPGGSDSTGIEAPSEIDDAGSATANLVPEMREALREATDAAAADGVFLEVNSGWRSAEEQQELFDAAVAQYGSEEEAARWVAPVTSMHVRGRAVDIGPLEATDWLGRNGARYGLCQTYANEAWHYEYMPEAIDGACPEQYADAGQDPRL